MFNKVILIGNLARDPELRYSQGGSAVCGTSIAVNRKWKDQNSGEMRDETCFIDITFFGRSAEVANQYLKKGSKILVEGRLKQDNWTDQNGQKRNKHSVVVETMQMLDSRNSNNDGQNGNQNTNNYQQQSAQPQNTQGQSAPTSSYPEYEDRKSVV